MQHGSTCCFNFAKELINVVLIEGPILRFAAAQRISNLNLPGVEGATNYCEGSRC
jgi:hypothetical protein